jgi:hypothetical protein
VLATSPAWRPPRAADGCDIGAGAGAGAGAGIEAEGRGVIDECGWFLGERL